MNVVIFGATGMVGRGVLLEAIDSSQVTGVLCIGRSSTGVAHPKLRELLHEDFEDLGPLAADLTGLDACFWCLGISALGSNEATYTRVTQGFTMAAAKVLRERSPGLCFCFCSAEGASDTGSGRIMWARVKGQTENALRRAGFGEVVVFRPGFIRALRGCRPRGALYEIFYTVFGVFNPFLRLLGSATSTVEIGRAMVAAALGRADKPVLNCTDINRLATRLEPPRH